MSGFSTSPSAVLASAALTGSPTAPTPSANDNDTSIATTAYVQTEIAFRGALVVKSADQTTLNASGAGVALTWDSETGGYDTDTIHDNSTNPSRLTVPAGVTRVRLSAQVYWLLTTADTFKLLQIEKNGSFAYVGSASNATEIGASSGSGQIHSPVLTVVAGDYFEIRLFEESDTSITIESDNSWFAMEIIE